MSVEAKIEITAGMSRLPAGLRAAMKAVQGFVTATTGLLGKQKKDLDERSIARGAAVGGVASGLAMRGIDAITGQAKEVWTFEKELMRFGISARISGDELRGWAAAARQISNETGKSALEVLRGSKAYTDLAGAQHGSIDKMRILARVAQATGADSADLAGVMFQLTRSMKITDARELEETLGGLSNQAKDGAIEMKEMSKEFAGILPLAARFGLTGREGANYVGAMYQVMRDGFNSSAEAATGLQRILAGIPSHASKFEEAGVKIWKVGKDGRKTLLPIQQIFKAIQESSLMKDPEKLKKAFGRTEGWRGFLLYTESLKRFFELVESGKASGVIGQDLFTATESSAGRMDIALETLKNKFADMLSPQRINDFVAGVEGLTQAMGPLLEVTSLVAQGFAWYLKMAHRAGSYLKGDRQWLTPEDKQFALDNGMDDPPGTDRRWKKIDDSPQGVARKARINAENWLMDAVVDAEDDHEPTMASTEIAMRKARASIDPKQRGRAMVPEEFAPKDTVEEHAVRYLKKAHIPPQIMLAVEQKLLAEEKAQLELDAGRPLREGLTGGHHSRSKAGWDWKEPSQAEQIVAAQKKADAEYDAGEALRVALGGEPNTPRPSVVTPTVDNPFADKSFMFDPSKSFIDLVQAKITAPLDKIATLLANKVDSMPPVTDGAAKGSGN